MGARFQRGGRVPGGAAARAGSAAPHVCHPHWRTAAGRPSRADRESRSGAEGSARPPTSAEQRRSLLLTHAGGGGGVGSWRRGEGASARARPRGGEPAGARGGEEGGSRARAHDDGRHPQASGLPRRGWPVRPWPPCKALRTTPAPVRQCARGGLKRAPTRAGAACESEQAQRGRKAACRLASHRRGRAPARLPRQREARGARQRVALCLGIAAAGLPTSLLRPIHHGLAERRAARLVPRHFGLGEWFRDLSQASGASQRVQRASVACSSNGACGGWPCTPRSFVWPQPGGFPPRRNSLAIGALFTRGVHCATWFAPW